MTKNLILDLRAPHGVQNDRNQHIISDLLFELHPESSCVYSLFHSKLLKPPFSNSTYLFCSSCVSDRQ